MRVARVAMVAIASCPTVAQPISADLTAHVTGEQQVRAERKYERHEQTHIAGDHAVQPLPLERAQPSHRINTAVLAITSLAKAKFAILVLEL